MNNQDAQPVSLLFDEAKSFSENCEAFLSSLEIIDAAMAAILRDNWDALVTIVQNGQRDSKTRSEFSAKVATALDALAETAEPKGGA
ncbi:MAG: hypothetical protein OEV28_04190 [Nitrospirota bacterium]|nr:hypothetical protein [Nitrospirota bacterium]